MSGPTTRKEWKASWPYLILSAIFLLGTLQKRVQFWMRVRHDKSDDIKVSSIVLNSYKSRNFVKIDNDTNKVVALVGDAAFGVPYFRSLNNGILCGTQFAKAAVSAKTGNMSKIKTYNTFVHRLAFWEMSKARIKSIGINAFNSYVNIVGWLPEKTAKAFERYISLASKEYS